MEYIIEEVNPKTGQAVQVLATATKAIIGRAAFDAACAYLPNAHIVVQIKAKVIAKQAGSISREDIGRITEQAVVQPNSFRGTVMGTTACKTKKV